MVIVSAFHTIPVKSEHRTGVPNTANQFFASDGAASFVIKADNTLWAYGANSAYNLGDGTNTDRYSPIKILDNVATVTAGNTRKLALKKDGTLWVWGYADSNADKKPAKLMDNVQSISAFDSHCAAVKTDGTLWCWGANLYGQVGNGTTEYVSKPVKVLDNVAEVCVSEDYTVALKKNGEVWGWGIRIFEYGKGKTSPVKILDNVKFISAGYTFCTAIKTDGTLWTWGDLFNLGGEYSKFSETPVQILDNVKYVSAGTTHAMAIKTDNTLWGWGGNLHGEVDGRAALNTSPSKPIKLMDDVARVVAGRAYTAAIKTDGTLWTWGVNMFGERGNGTKTPRGVPWEPVHKPTQILDNVADIYLANSYAVAVKNDGSLWAWGDNRSGNLGDGTANESLVPKKVMDGVRISEIPLPEITIILNGSRMVLDQPPVIENGRTLVPVAVIASALGAETGWNGETEEVTITKDGTVISLAIGSGKVRVDGREFAIDVPPRIIGGRTMVPVNFVSTQLGANVTWNGTKRQVIITTE